MQLEPEQGRHPRVHGEHAPDHLTMLRDMRAPWLWTNATAVMLGLWLLSSPFTFGYLKAAMIWSDVISGVLLAIFAAVAFIPRFDFIGRWSVALIGVWLEFAPLVFWARSPVAYLNDTLVGALAITLSILVPIRGFRFLNLLFGVWLLIALWALAGASTSVRWSDMSSGVALLALTLPRGVVRERYGSWDRYVV